MKFTKSNRTSDYALFFLFLSGRPELRSVKRQVEDSEYSVSAELRLCRTLSFSVASLALKVEKKGKPVRHTGGGCWKDFVEEYKLENMYFFV
jgi:hypothetical protein